MKKICLFLGIILLLSPLSAKRPTGLVMSQPNTNCHFGWSLMLSDYNSDNIYDKAFIYNCSHALVKECQVRENYNLSDIPGYYFGELISGTYEWNDYVCLIKDSKSYNSVAKVHYLPNEDVIVIDALTKTYNPSEGFIDNLDEFFTFSMSKYGIVSLVKKKDFTVHHVILTDINGSEITQFAVDNNSYIIDLSTQPQGAYFIRMMTTEGLINKKLLFVKE